jgi:hypothetical protein
MEEAQVLDGIADEMDAILGRFSHGRDGIHISTGDQAKFRGLVLEARDLLSLSVLGPLNNFGLQLEAARQEGTQNFMVSQSYHSVEQAIGIVRSAANALRRRTSRPPNLAVVAAGHRPYVDLKRIEQLRGAGQTSHDLARLVRMCEELNSVFAGGNLLATTMLLRAIVDHVPPIFGTPNFGQYTSSIAGRSIKASMIRLDKASRDIADTWLHQQIRRTETLPTATQVDFRQELDLLLGEVLGAAR